MTIQTSFKKRKSDIGISHIWYPLTSSVKINNNQLVISFKPSINYFIIYFRNFWTHYTNNQIEMFNLSVDMDFIVFVISSGNIKIP